LVRTQHLPLVKPLVTGLRTRREGSGARNRRIWAALARLSLAARSGPVADLDLCR
jgi:hypothetical protein